MANAFHRALLACCLLVAVSACDQVPFTERKQFVVISESQEQAMGDQAARQIRRTAASMNTKPTPSVWPSWTRPATTSMRRRISGT